MSSEGARLRSATITRLEDRVVARFWLTQDFVVGVPKVTFEIESAGKVFATAGPFPLDARSYGPFATD